MANYCPPLGALDGLAVPLLQTIDCQIGNAVASSYGALFGQGALFSQALTIILTLYVAVYAYQLMLGRAQLSLSQLAPKIMLIGLVLALASNWAVYQILIQNLLFRGPEQIATAMLPGSSDAAFDFAARLDVFFARITEVATHWSTAARELKPVPNVSLNGVSLNGASLNGAPVAVLGLQQGPALAGNLLWISAGLFLLASVGLLVIAKLMLGALLGVGPAFLVLVMFAQTRGFFEGWLKAAVLFALVPMVVIILTTATLGLLDPLVAQIVLGDRAGVLVMKDIITLLFAVLIFCGAIWQTMRLASTIATSWHLPSATVPAPAVSDAPWPGSLSAARSDEQQRVSSMVSSIERSVSSATLAAAAPSGVPDRRTSVVTLEQPGAARPEATPPRALGQQFRRPAIAPRASGLR